MSESQGLPSEDWIAEIVQTLEVRTRPVSVVRSPFWNLQTQPPFLLVRQDRILLPSRVKGTAESCSVDWGGLVGVVPLRRAVAIGRIDA